MGAGRPKEARHRTPNGHYVTAGELDRLLNENTLAGVANILGYRGVNAIKRMYKKLNNKEWVRKERFIQRKTQMKEGVITFTTPSGMIVDADMLNHMLSEYTKKEVADKLGYQHTNSLNWLFKHAFQEKIKRNVFNLRNNDREFLVEIHKFLLRNRYAPSSTDLTELTGQDGRSIRAKVKKLVDDKYLGRVENRGNTIFLTQKGLSEILPDDDEEYIKFEKKILKKLNTLYK